MALSKSSHYAMIQDSLTGRIVDSGWISTEQQSRLARADLVALAADEDGSPAATATSWRVTSTTPLASGVLLLQTATVDGHETGDWPLPFLQSLENTLEARRSSEAEKSYTRSLFEAGPGKVGDKLREEADELACALAEETDERVVSEAADVVYHLLVALRVRRLPMRRVIEVLLQRTGQSGHEEKARRQQ